MPTFRHPHPPRASFDGGDLDCGSGLLLLIRKHIDPLAPGELLEVVSRELSVGDDLPAWCRLTGNELVSHLVEGGVHSFLVAKGHFDAARTAGAPPATSVAPVVAAGARAASAPAAPDDETLPAPAPAPAVRPFSVMGIGSWPRPAWLLRALHERLEGRLPEAEFEAAADDAVRLVVEAQRRAGVDLVTDGEQRRDNYASFVGARLDGCQLVPVTDLLPYVHDPAAFERQLRSLDVPAEKVRHPAVVGRIVRRRPVAAHELAFLRRVTDLPAKVALPGPYLLTRTMWMECVSDNAYTDREALAADVVRALRAEVAALLAGGASLVQVDEPVLSEVVFGRPSKERTFMCGALGEKRAPAEELAFAEALLAATLAGFPRERLALHMCRGNWTPDEAAALSGDYRPLLGVLSKVPVGTLMLEMCTKRAGDVEVLADLPRDRRVGVGVLDQKSPRVETRDEVVERAERAVRVLGADRVLLVPDCGFATFADNPIASAAVAEGKLAAASAAAAVLRARHGV